MPLTSRLGTLSICDMPDDLRTLISVSQLRSLLDEPSSNRQTRVLDCRFSLADPFAGRRAYERGHIPGAQYADLERDLSSPHVAGVTGRHPLPPVEQLAKRFGSWGIAKDTQVVVYDDNSGAIAARAWWLLRWLGHDAVALLDGGFDAWAAMGGELHTEPVKITPVEFESAARHHMLVDADQVAEMLQHAESRVFDARAPERFRGEVEPIDPVAGHIPGARSLPFADNLRDGGFRSREELQAHFRVALGTARPEMCAVYCGSGVTACHGVLAAEHAGLPGLKLYAGSWSDWITDTSRGVER